MRMNEIIKERRLAKNLTQEQVALRLGVTAPAVNKWEKGTSYPDITILPALARLLETDLNTLLSFKEDLTEEEIGGFLNTLSEMLDKDGFDKAYAAGMAKIKEYPNCDLLILNTALFLESGRMMDKNAKKSSEARRTEVEALYERAAASENPAVRSQARSILIYKYMQKKDYEKAEALLKELPDKNPVDKKQIQANLFIERGELGEAARLEEEKLMSAANEIQTTLMTLMEIALKENRMEDAEYMAEASKKTVEILDLWEYNAYVAHFQLYSVRKERMKCLKVLIPMLKSLTRKWDINGSPLYRHVKTKKVENGFGPKLQKSILSSILEDEDMAFLKDSEELKAIVDEVNSKSC